VRAKSILKSVRDVRACGSFLGVRCAIALLHTFWNKIAKKCYFRTFLIENILSCSRTSYSVVEYPKNVEKLLKNVEKLLKNVEKLLKRD